MTTPIWEIAVRFEANLDRLLFVSEVMQLVFSHVPVTEEEKSQIDLAVSEGMTNAIKNTTEGTVALRITHCNTELVVSIIDQGKGFDIQTVQEPDFENHPESGYGIYIMRQLMDYVDYKQEDTGNVLTLRKSLSAS